MNDDAVIAAKPQHVSVDLSEGAVVLDTDLGLYFAIEGVGSRIWELIASPRRLAEIQETIVAEYDVDPAQCRADLERFVSDLQTQGLIEVRDDQAG